MSVTRRLPLTSIVFFSPYYKVQWGINCLVINIIQNIFFCVQQKKEIHTGLEKLEENLIFHFWVNCPFK